MFAEASLQGAIMQRVWRYDDAVRFYLSTRRAQDSAACFCQSKSRPFDGRK